MSKSTPSIRPPHGILAVAIASLAVTLVILLVPVRQPIEASVRPHDKRWTREVANADQGSDVYQFAILVRCVAEVSLRQTTEAVRDCGALIAMSPRNPAGYKLRGMAYFGEGQFDNALMDLDHAIVLDPSDAELYGAKGAVFRARSETDRAIGAYSRAIELEPDASKWWNGRCWTRAVAREELQNALADCNRALALDSHFAIAFDSRGLVFLQLNRNSEAVRDYSRALALTQLASSFFGRGVAKLRLADGSGHFDLARARAMDPTIDRTFRRFGIVAGESPKSPERPSRKPPGPPSESPRARSAGIDLDHGRQTAGR